jgi:hypothetical protein
MLVVNLQQEKDKINTMLSNGIQEILYKGLRVKEKSLGSLEDDVGIMLRAFQLKNIIYDYAVFITYSELFNRFEGKVVYSLINTENMEAKEADKYEALLEFNF